MSKIEDTAMSALHRRLLLISINEAIETEAKELSMKTKRVQCIDKDLGAVSRKLSKERNSPGIRLRAESDAVKRRRTESVAELEHKETTLTEERGRLKDEIENYPKGKPPRWRVTRKIYNDISGIKGLSPEERKRAGDRFSDYAQLGRRYHQLHPLGVLIFLGKTSIMFEQTPWTSLEYDAMLSYWQYFSGIYHLCQLYSPLLERLKRRWSPLSTGPMEQEVDTPRLSLASPPAITAPPEGNA